jgi:hypothetical protein
MDPFLNNYICFLVLDTCKSACRCSVFFVSFCFVFVVLWFKLKTALTRKILYHLNHASILFCSGYFRDTVLLFAKPAWTELLLFHTFCHSWDDGYVPPHPAIG